MSNATSTPEITYAAVPHPIPANEQPPLNLTPPVEQNVRGGIPALPPKDRRGEMHPAERDEIAQSLEKAYLTPNIYVGIDRRHRFRKLCRRSGLFPMTKVFDAMMDSYSAELDREGV